MTKDEKLSAMTAIRYTDLERLYDVVMEWSCDRAPRDGYDCDVMIELWRLNGDRTEPCPECDGECGEPCAPVTAAHAIAELGQARDAFFAKYKASPAPHTGGENG